MYLPEKLLTSVSTDSKQREVGYLGKQVFELSNHLGNVLVDISLKVYQHFSAKFTTRRELLKLI
jgi:hypothetical protein